MKSYKSMSNTEKAIRIFRWLAIDVVVLLIAYTLAFFARAVTAPLDYVSSFWFVALSVAITIVCLNLNKVYHTYWQGASGQDIVVLMRSIIWATTAIFMIDLTFAKRPLPLSVVLMAAVLGLGGLVVVRYRGRLIGAAEWRWNAIWNREFPDEKRERVLIIGAGESGQITARRLREHSGKDKYKIVGFVDDDGEKQGLIIQSAEVMGGVEDIPRIVKDNRVALIVIAIHNIEGSDFREIIELCEQTTARIKIVPDVFKLFNSKVSTTFLRDIEPEDLIGRKIVTRDEKVDLSVISNRIVMVTGAAGSIGSELARQIVMHHDPKQLILLDNNESGLFEIELEIQAMDKGLPIKGILGDITQPEQINAIFETHKPQVVFHAAAYKHVPMLEKFPNEAVRVNIGGTLNMARAAIQNKVERFVLISTDKAVNPSSVMGASKRVCELLIHTIDEGEYHDTMFTAVRFGNVLGSRGSVVPIFNRQIDNGGPVTVTDEQMTRYFMSISEAVNLVIHAAALTNGNDIFVLRMGEVVRIVDLAKRMIRLRGLRPQEDIEIIYTGKRPGEKMTEELTASFEQLGNTIHPGIRRMQSWSLNGHSRDFMDSIHTLIREGIPAQDNPLETLVSVCREDLQVAHTVD